MYVHGGGRRYGDVGGGGSRVWLWRTHSQLVCENMHVASVSV